MVAHCWITSFTSPGKTLPTMTLHYLQRRSAWSLEREHTHTRTHTVSGKTKTTTLGRQIFRRLLFLSIYFISLFSSPSLFIDTLDDDFSLYSEFLNLLRCSCMFSWRVLGSCSVILVDWSADRVDLWCLFTGLTLRPATLRSPLLLARPPLKREMKSQVRLFFCNCYDLCRTCFSIYKLVQLFKGFICWVLMNSLFYFVHRKYLLYSMKLRNLIGIAYFYLCYFIVLM